MRVLQVHLADGPKGGGGGIATYRLHLGLRQRGVDSRLLCRTVTRDSPDVFQLPRLPKIEYYLGKITRRLGLNDIHLVSSFQVPRIRVFQESEVIDFQGIHTQTLSYLALPTLTRHRPAVFTMHDMWALTGHCAYSYDCERWKTGCGECPYPKTHPAIPDTRLARNNTRVEWQLKRWAYRHSNLAFVAPSRWLVELAGQSMIAEFPIHHIPYGLDTDVYRPMDRQACRAQLGIAQRLEGRRSKVLMFGALKLDNHRKGGDLLIQALRGLAPSVREQVLLLTLGTGAENIDAQVGIPAHHLDYISDETKMATAYNAADLFLCPTRADNLPLVLLESMACGTPMVAFAVGGVPELVRQDVTGHLAEPGRTDDLAGGIAHLLEDEARLNWMRQQAREIAVREYRRELQVERYTELYGRLRSGQAAHRATRANRARRASDRIDLRSQKGHQG